MNRLLMPVFIRYKLLGTVLMLWAALLPAQEQQLASPRQPESEVTATANPLNTDRLVVAAIRDVSDSQGRNQSRLSVYYSADGGQSWQSSPYQGMQGAEVPPTLLIGDPVLTHDLLGRAYLAHIIWEGNGSQLTTHLYVAESSDGGQSWHAQLLRSGSQQIYDKPWITTDISADSPYLNDVYVAFTRVDVEGNQARHGIYLVKKKAGNSNFEATTVQVNRGEYAVTQFANVSCDKAGRVYVAFVANDGSRNYLYVARSLDGGQTFEPEQRVARLGMYYANFGVLTTILNQQGLARLYPCPQLVADRSGGPYQNRLYLSWTDIEPDPLHYGLDVFLSYSDDQGQSWSSPRQVFPQLPPNNHQFYSSLAVNEQGSLLLACYDRRDDPQNLRTHYYTTFSRDGGQTFEPAVAVSARPADFSRVGQKNHDFGVGEYNQLLAVGPYAMPFWADGRNNNGDLYLYTARVQVEAETAILHSHNNISPYFYFASPHPNPIRGEVQLSFELRQAMQVELGLYNALGRRLGVVARGSFGAGLHQLGHRPGPLPAGVYHYRLHTPYGLAGRRVLLVH